MVNRINVKPIGLVLLTVFLFTACGQKRALYLPNEPVTNNTVSDSEPLTESTTEQGKD
jgi:predicted small lipoprotein YifL